MYLAAKVNDQEWDISRPINDDATIQLFKWEDAEGKHAFWHSSAHLLAEALQELFPGVKFGIGPAIENGFYYDIDPAGNTITAADFPAIEKRCLNSRAGRTRSSVPTSQRKMPSSSLAIVASTTSVNSSPSSRTGTSPHTRRAHSPTSAVARI